jgi:exopolysaccharide biosynthesis predicted pyruvyltransferase EpsI
MSRQTDQTVHEVLNQYCGKRAYCVPMQDENGVDFGNNGDDLIQFGGERLLAECGLLDCRDPDAADVHVIRGNGAMVQAYAKARRVLINAWNDFPNKPLLMLPATFHYPEKDFFEGLDVRAAPVTLFCRERYSFDHLLNDHTIPDGCSIGLGHDTAFQLQSDDIVQRRLNRPGKHVLIVERTDFEHPSKNKTFWNRSGNEAPRHSLFRHIPTSLKQPFYPIRSLLRRKKRTPFRNYCEHVLTDQFPQFGGLPKMYADVSDRSVCDFEGFCERIADAAVVFSTRLHVGIYAAMLGKKAFVFEGPYHKIRAIYEHSMQEYEDLTFVARTEYLTTDA